VGNDNIIGSYDIIRAIEKIFGNVNELIMKPLWSGK